MVIKKAEDTGNKKWPKKVTYANGKKILIPQQQKFNAFSRAHGCSLAGVTVALQLYGVRKSPTQIHAWAKKHIPGYTGSKLTIYGACKAINGLTGKKVAKWYPITGKNNNEVIQHIREMVKSGAIVLVEQKRPIHTNAIIGARKAGGCYIATNGTIKKTTVTKLVKAALHGYVQKSKQVNWYKSGQSKRAAGYVVVKPE